LEHLRRLRATDGVDLYGRGHARNLVGDAESPVNGDHMDLPIEDLAQAEPRASRPTLRVVVAGIVLLVVGVGVGAGAVFFGRTFAQEQLEPVRERVSAVESRQATIEAGQASLAAEFHDHRAREDVRDQHTLDKMADVARSLEKLNASVQDVKELCIRGGGCSPRLPRER
jgi:hypothetical protein